MADPKTALIFLISTSAVSGFVALLLWKLHKGLRGLGILAASNLLLCVSFATVIDRSPAGITVHNMLIVAAQFTLAEGILVFMGRRPAWSLLAGLEVLTAALWAAMLWAAPADLPLRVAAITVLTVFIFGRLLALMLRRRGDLGVPEWVIVTVLALHIVLLVARMAISLLHPDSQFVWSPALLGWAFLEMTLVTVLMFFAILLMVGGRLASDLQRQGAALATERRVKSELRQFLHMLGHELQTPLAVIARSAESVRTLLDPAPPEAERQLAAMRDTVKRVERLAENLLMAERAGMEQPRPEILDLAAVIAEAADLLGGKWGEGRLRATFPPAPIQVVGDRELLFTAVTNLLDNALKYSPPHSPVLALLETVGGEALLRVRDHGIGFPEEQLALLGQRFFRADNARAHAGTGLGLYMVKTIAQRHGGRVELVNAAGGGAEVTLSLPAA
ncbi:MAG: HAMP domain-containing histidine kinase [Magnetospirillum sp.]|nr:HAMP domain-containing histidine kinase [Magnetospirillum sp.]